MTSKKPTKEQIDQVRQTVLQALENVEKGITGDEHPKVIIHIFNEDGHETLMANCSDKHLFDVAASTMAGLLQKRLERAQAEQGVLVA